MLGSLFRRSRARRGLVSHALVWGRNLLLVAVIVVAGARFYSEYKLDKQLDQFAGMVAPVGTLTFGKSYTAFNGDIGVETVSFIPDRGLDAPPARLRKGVLHTPGYLWVLGFRGGGRIPNTMGVSLEGLNVELGEAAGGNPVSGVPLETLGCGDVSEFQTIDLDAMGFGPLETSLSGRYRLLPPERAELQLVVQVSDAAETHVDIELLVENLAEAVRGGAPPVV